MAGQLVVGNMLNLEEYEDDIKDSSSCHKLLWGRQVRTQTQDSKSTEVTS